MSQWLLRVVVFVSFLGFCLFVFYSFDPASDDVRVPHSLKVIGVLSALALIHWLLYIAINAIEAPG